MESGNSTRDIYLPGPHLSGPGLDAFMDHSRGPLPRITSEVSRKFLLEDRFRECPDDLVRKLSIFEYHERRN